MCGFVGTVDLAFGPDLLELIAHRGPDDTGFETIACGAGTVRFGHKRLSIVDLTPAGHQPMLSPTGRSAIIFNGEIYNHESLRCQLDFAGFRGRSDTETLLHYLEERGINGIHDFNGIFAFAWLDIANRMLYLARDRFGVKPLYIRRSGGCIAFSSEIKPLLRLLGPANVDVEALSTYLTLRYNPSPETMFRGIRRVAAGDVLRFDLCAAYTATLSVTIHSNTSAIRSRQRDANAER